MQNVCFCPEIEFTFSYAIQEKPISIFRVKFNVEFTRQAAIEFFYSIFQKCLWPILSNGL